jgi:hypothetical protein
VGKNANKLGVLAGVALLLFVFGCESKQKKEQDSIRQYNETSIKPDATREEIRKDREKRFKEVEKQIDTSTVFTESEKEQLKKVFMEDSK